MRFIIALVFPTDINLLIADIGQANLRQITTLFILTLTLDLTPQNYLVTGKGTLVLEQPAPLPSLCGLFWKRSRQK